jgi:hypothetical protein
VSNSKLITIPLSGDPYDSELFCPYCGEQILEPEAEGTGDCPHLVHADIEEPDDEEVQANDLCFMFFEPAPASRHHYFVFREVGDVGDEEDA